MTSARSESSIIESLLLEDEEGEEAQVNVKDYQETSSKGKVKGSIGLQYMLAGGNVCFVSFVFVLYVLAQVAASGVDYFVSYWTYLEERSNETPLNGDTKIEPVQFSRETCLYIYAGLIISLFVIALARSMLFYKLAMMSSQKLHDSMFMNVIYSPMRFFDTNPSGRILNRFSKDIGATDELLPKAILDAGQVSYLYLSTYRVVQKVLCTDSKRCNF